MRWLLLALLVCGCAPDGAPNPVYTDDEWAAKGCEQHGGTCGGGLFGGCPAEGSWRVDDSLMCNSGGYFRISCCVPAGGSADTSTLDPRPADAGDEVAIDAAEAESVEGASLGGAE